ncbi:MAG TPA: GNAT family N-acetyltransferase [Pyrinomonadaceae bacterium]|nr:GNAT family N-acetyltransferase [Pyrinomonadaceae bacterium]
MNYSIETERLRLRPFTLADLPALRAMRTKEEVTRYLGTSALQTPEFVEARLGVYLECYERYNFGVAGVEERGAEGTLIGWGGLMPLEFGWNGKEAPADPRDAVVEVGYGFDTPHWGKGYATEVATAWLRYGFEYAKLPRIVAVASPENTGSWRVMEKLGMRYEKREEHYGSECVVYAITREEFAPRADAFRVLPHNR